MAARKNKSEGHRAYCPRIRNWVLMLFVLVLLCAGWARSERRIESVTYTWRQVTVRQPPPDDPTASWNLDTHWVRIWHGNGSLGVGFGQRTGVAYDAGSLARARPWRSWNATSETFREENLREETNKWRGPLNWKWGPFCFGEFGRQGSSLFIVAAPYWALLVVPVALLTRAAGRSIRQRLRVRAGQCPRCGYSFGGPSCPECGHHP